MAYFSSKSAYLLAPGKLAKGSTLPYPFGAWGMYVMHTIMIILLSLCFFLIYIMSIISVASYVSLISSFVSLIELYIVPIELFSPHINGRGKMPCHQYNILSEGSSISSHMTLFKSMILKYLS